MESSLIYRPFAYCTLVCISGRVCYRALCVSIKLGSSYRIERQRFTAALLPRLFWSRIPSHTTRESQIGFKLATDCIQFYVYANVDKT